MSQANGIHDEFMATTATGKWSRFLWAEMKARGWKQKFVHRRTGRSIASDHADANQYGVWVFKFSGFDSDEAIIWARSQQFVKVRKKGDV